MCTSFWDNCHRCTASPVMLSASFSLLCHYYTVCCCHPPLLPYIILFCYCHPILLLSYTALPLSCYFAIAILLNAVTLLCHSCSCLAIVIVLCRSCCQPFPWYSITFMLYMYLPLSGHFSTVMLHCCCHTALPLYMLITTVLLLCHRHTAMPANADC